MELSFDLFFFGYSDKKASGGWDQYQPRNSQMVMIVLFMEIPYCSRIHQTNFYLSCCIDIYDISLWSKPDRKKSVNPGQGVVRKS